METEDERERNSLFLLIEFSFKLNISRSGKITTERKIDYPSREDLDGFDFFFSSPSIEREDKRAICLFSY